MNNDVLRQYDRPTPSYIHDILSKFGQNPRGENVYRLVWSESVTETIGGVWEDRAREGSNTLVRKGRMLMDSNPVIQKSYGYRVVSKYPDLKGDKARWVLEKWLPCSYSSDIWEWLYFDPESDCYLSGPYPEAGEYWCSRVLSDHGDFMEATADAVEYYARLVAAGDEYADWQKREADEARKAKSKRDYDNNFDAVFDDCQPVGGVAAVFSGPGRKTNRKSLDDVKFVKAPSWLPQKAGNAQF
jgi:hypothetical protein